MFKVLTFLKKRHDLSSQEFRKYYEEHHARLGKQVLGSDVRRYVRRYLTPFSATGDAALTGLDYDVITETWFDSRETFESVMQRLNQPEIQSLIVEDEKKLFDRSRNYIMYVEEEETRL